MIRWIIGYVVLLAFSGGALYGQETQRGDASPAQPADTVQRHNTGGILFDRSLNTFTWIGRASIDTAFGHTRFSMNELFSSNVIQVDAPGSRKLQSNQQNISMLVSQPVLEHIDVAGQWSSLVYSDNRGVGLGNASMHSVLGGAIYSPFASFSVTPMAGYRWDNQESVHDQGASLQLAAQAHDLDFDGYLLNASGQYHTDDLRPRKLESDFAHLGVQKFFTADTRDSLEFGVIRSRREFYSSGDSSIESRLENDFLFSNLLNYTIDPRIVTSFYFGVNSRGLDKDLRYPSSQPPPDQFNTRIDEFNLETYVQTTYRSDDGRTGGFLRFGYAERDETHAARLPGGGTVPKLFEQINQQEESKNNLTRHTSLSGALEFPVSWSDRVFVSGSASILRYDTPSDLNLEDRDELLIAATIATHHRVSPYLDLDIVLDGSLTHLVYLLSDRSANNNFNRVLRLSPRTNYHPAPWLTTMNGFEVLANYTVYDFEQQVALVKSFSYRQFGWIDSSTVQITNRIGLDFLAYLKLYERGQLKWTEFKERTENSYIEKTYVVQVRFSPDPGLVFAPGIRFFSQLRYAYGQAGKTLDSYLRSIGPTCLLLWNVGPHSQIGLRGWYEDRRQTDGTRKGLTNMTMNILLNF